VEENCWVSVIGNVVPILDIIIHLPQGRRSMKPKDILDFAGDAPFPPASTAAVTGRLSMHHYRNSGVLEHMARNTAQNQLSEPRMRIGAHHQKVTGKFCGSGQ
jgi:hypothetical protein